MKTNHTNNQTDSKKSGNNEMDVEVLYQKLGDRWFAFSLVGDEVFMAPVPDEAIAEIRTRNTSRAPDETV